MVSARESHPAFRRHAAVSGDGLIVVSRLTKIFRPLQLRLRSLRPVRRQDAVCALRDVSLTVQRGEIFGLVGTNGAGKTTLLKILATLILPTSGRALLGGCDVGAAADDVRAQVGLVAGEERSFYWRLTGQHNLEFFAAFQGLRARAARMRISQLQVQLGLEALERRVGTYSTGMRHRLAIARALLHDPPILLLDEPTRSLDPLAAAQLRRLIKDELVVSCGKTVLIATHNLHEAEELCTRIAMLHQGRLAGCGTIEALRHQAGDHAATLTDVFERLAQAAPQPC